MAIEGCILEYSRRSLTYESDILNAFLGIFRAYQRMNGTWHLWGIPINQYTVFAQQTKFINCLFWYFTAYGADRAAGDNKIVVARRSGFPLWSWTGWTAIQCQVDLNGRDTDRPVGLQIFCTLHDGSILTWERLKNTAVSASLSNSVSPKLQITAPVLPANFVRKGMIKCLSGTHICDAEVDVNMTLQDPDRSGPESGAPLNDEADWDEEVYHAVLLGHYRSTRAHTDVPGIPYPAFLIVRGPRSGAERIGAFGFSAGSAVIYGHSGPCRKQWEDFRAGQLSLPLQTFSLV